MRLTGDDGVAFESASVFDRRQSDQEVLALRRAVNANGFWAVGVPPVVSKTSSHLAGTVPYGGSVFGLKRSGELLPGIFVCDGACFPTGPAASPTFTIMANAGRTVTEAIA